MLTFVGRRCRSRLIELDVERQIGVTYKTAWRMCHEIRKYMAMIDGDEPIGGEGEAVEIDETLIGGRLPGAGWGNYRQNKTVVLGMIERGGNIVTKVIPNVKKTSLFPAIAESVKEGTAIYIAATLLGSPQMALPLMVNGGVGLLLAGLFILVSKRRAARPGTSQKDPSCA